MSIVRRLIVVLLVVLAHAYALSSLRLHFRPPETSEASAPIQIVTLDISPSSGNDAPALDHEPDEPSDHTLSAEPSGAVTAPPLPEPERQPDPAPVANEPKLHAPVASTAGQIPAQPETEPAPVSAASTIDQNADPATSVSPAVSAAASSPNASRGTAVGSDAVGSDDELFRIKPSWTAIGLHNPRADYPEISKRLGEEGTATVSVYVSEAGTAIDAVLKTSSGFDRLDESAIEAVLKWRYKPGELRGQRKAMWTDIPIVFRLTN